MNFNFIFIIQTRRFFYQMPRTSAISFWMHTVLGLTVGLFLLGLGVSGSILTFRPEIEKLHSPSVVMGTRSASFDEAIETIRKTDSSLRLLSIRLPARASDTLEITAKDSLGQSIKFHVDPYSAQILDRSAGGWLEFVHEFHHDLFSGRTGRVILGIVGWATVLLCITGGVTLLSRGRGLRAALGSPLALRSSHHSIGILVLPFLLTIALTSTAFTWGKQYNGLLRRLDGAQSASVPVTSANSIRLSSAAAILDAAQAAIPDAQPTLLRFPQKPRDPVIVRMRSHGDLRDMGTGIVYVDGASAAVLQVVRNNERPLSTRISDSFLPLHSGEFGGVATRLIWCLVGIAPGVLFITGGVIWQRRMWPSKAHVARPRPDFISRFPESI